MKAFCSSVSILRDTFNEIREEMLADEKPRSVDWRIVRPTRSLEQNDLFHVVIRQIRKHLFDSGRGIVEYEDEVSSRRVRMPLDEQIVKDLVKQTLGTVFVVMGKRIAKPTAKYEPHEMWNLLQKIDAWAATDLGLQIVYKKRWQAIEDKYEEQSDVQTG